MRVCGRSLAGIAGSNPAGGMDVCVVCVLQSKKKGKVQDNPDKETSMDEVQRQNKRKKFRWRRDFPHPYTAALGPTQPPIMCIESFPRVKSPGCGVYHPPPPSARVKERLQLYLYSTPPLGLQGVLQRKLYLLPVVRRAECWTPVTKGTGTTQQSNNGTGRLL